METPFTTTVSPLGTFMAIFGVSTESFCPKAKVEKRIIMAKSDFFIVVSFTILKIH
jgi:hypothetical protein